MPVTKVAMLSHYEFEGVHGLSPIQVEANERLPAMWTRTILVRRFPFVPVLLSALHDLSLTELYFTATTGTSEYVYYYCEPRVNIVKATSDREIMPGTATTLEHSTNKK
jgi:hypothetical protein